MPLFLSPNLPSFVCLDLCESYESFGRFARDPPYLLEPGKWSTCRSSNVEPTPSQRSEVAVWHIRSTWLFTRCLTPGSCQCPWKHRDQIWPATRPTSAKHHGVGAGVILAINLNFPQFCGSQSITRYWCRDTSAWYVQWEGRHQGFLHVPRGSSHPETRAGLWAVARASSCYRGSSWPRAARTQLTEWFVITCPSGWMPIK